MKHLYVMALAFAVIGANGAAQATGNTPDPKGTAPVAVAAGDIATTHAAMPVDVQPNAVIVTADGRRLGRVDHVRSSVASIIFAGHFVSVPVSTLTPTKDGFVTSLKTADLVRR